LLKKAKADAKKKKIWKDNSTQLNSISLPIQKTDRVTVVKKFQKLSKQSHFDPKR